MTTVQKWTGRETRALRQALRMSTREFATHLGITERTISKWEAPGGELVPRPSSQAMLSTMLGNAPQDARTRFETALRTGASHRATARSAPQSDERGSAADFTATVERLMHAHGMSVRATARAAGYSDHTLLSKVLNGHKPVTPYLASKLDRALGANGEITAAAHPVIVEAEAARHAGISAEEVNTTLRRDFITLGGFGGLAVAGQLWGTLESEPDNIHMALDRGTTSAERASYVEGVADDLGVQVVKAHPLSVLQPALASLQSIRRLLEVRQPTRQQVRLVRSSAKLCTVVGEIMFNVGQFQKAHEWYVTAEHAAHDVGDQYLADIALAGQAYLPTYSEDPNGVLALLEPRLGGSPSPSPAIAWLWGFTARAHAALNHPELFQLAIDHAQDSLERSSPDAVGPGIYSFLPEKLAFYEATGAVCLNHTDRALAAANRALALYDLSETTEPTLAKLERASALAKGGEVPEACSVAAAALLDPTTYHGVTVRTYAAKFDGLVRDVDLPETREWREVRQEVHSGETAIAGKGGYLSKWTPRERSSKST